MSETLDPDVLIRVENVSKKFCKDFRKGLIYGVADLGREIIGAKNDNPKLRDKEFWALQDINFDLKKGETLGLVGVNGAGKSSLLKLIGGVMKPTTGKITINGKMQTLIELGGAFSPTLSGRENIYASAAMIGMTRHDIEDKMNEIIEFAELDDFIDAPVSSYSTGMRVRLGFSIAMCIQPDILIIDEVLAVGDLNFQIKSLERVSKIRERAGGVIFVSHHIHQMRRMCTKCMLIDRGQIVNYGDTETVIEDYLNRQVLKKPSASSQSELINASMQKHPDIHYEGYRLIQNGQITKTLNKGPFRIEFDIIIDSKFPDLWADLSISDLSSIPIIHESIACPNVAGKTGKTTFMFDIPDLNLKTQNYKPALTLHNGKSMDKILKAENLESFHVKTGHSPYGMLKAPVHLEISTSDNGQ